MREKPRLLVRVDSGLYRHERDGKKYGSYYGVYSDKGRRIKESLNTEDLFEARRILKARRAQDDRLDPTLRGQTLAEYCDKYLETRQGRAAGTLRQDRKNVERIKKQFWMAKKPLRTIKQSDCLTFLAGLKKEKDPRQPLGASDRNHLGWCLRKICALAVADGVIAANPAAGFRAEKGKDPIRLTPTWEQFKRIVDTIRHQPFADTRDVSADLVDFYGRAGLGTAEAAALQWQDIDLARGKIHVLRRKTGRGFVISIYPQLRPLIERLIQQAPKAAPTDPVFRIRDPKKALATACRQLKFPQFSPRSFRRMFITRCLEHGMDPGLVARTQGHSDGGALILKTYRHIRPAYENEMLERLKDE